LSFKNLNIINELLPTLTKSEVRLVRKLFHVEYNKPVGAKLESLFNKLHKSNSSIDVLNQEFTDKLQKRKRAEEYKRIRDVIQNAIVLDIFNGDNEHYSMLFSYKFQLRLLTTFAEIIKSRGAISSAVNILDKCENISREYQLYDQLIDILYIKSDIGFNGSVHYNLEAVLKDISHYELCRRRVKESKILYRDYFSKTVKKGIFKFDTATLKESIKKLKSYYKETGSKLIKLKSYLFEMELFLVTENYDKGTNLGKKAIKLLNDNFSVKTNSRIGYFHFNISETELGALRLQNAMKHACEAKGYFLSNSINRLVSSQFIVLASFYLERYKKSQEELDSMKGLNIFKSYPFYESKFSYYQAMLYFNQQDYDQAWKALSFHLDLEKDKEGWRVWLSIMRMICQIERDELIDVDLMVQSFRKYMKRWEERSEIREREKLVFKVIESLNRYEFDFNLTAEKEALALDKLRLTEGDLKWRPNSPELILFHDWFDCKCRNTPYKPNYQVYG